MKRPAEGKKRIGVIGAGSWGTALANLLAERDSVDLWVFEEDLFRAMADERENKVFLPGVRFAERIRLTRSLEEAFTGKDILVCALPSHAVREVFSQGQSSLPEDVLIVSATKGLESKSHQTASKVLGEIAGRARKAKIACLSGPSFAREVSRQLPTAVAVAGTGPEAARMAQKLFSRPYFRVYTSHEVTGVELGGSLKNIFAIGTGILDGMGLGNNSRAAVITRGLAEMTRLGARLGANPMTLMGLAGLGDLVLTCTSPQSRNFQVGMKLGKGLPLPEILGGMTEVAEGVKTTRAVHLLAQRLGVEMPLVDAVYRILYDGLTPREAIKKLMTRELKDELEAMTETW